MTKQEVAAHIAACKADPKDCGCDYRIVRCAKASCPRTKRQVREAYEEMNDLDCNQIGGHAV